jgi:hypothetical protein
MGRLLNVLLAHREYVLTVPATPLQVADQLRSALNAQPRARWPLRDGRVKGTVKEQSFTLALPNTWWHSNAPYWRLRGQIVHLGGGAEIRLTRALHPMFFLLTMALPAVLFFPLFLKNVASNPLAAAAVWVALPLGSNLIFRVYPLLDGLFSRESAEDRRLLRFVREAVSGDPGTKGRGSLRA